jgi:putative membrane protein
VKTGNLKNFIQRWLINTLAVLVAISILGDARIHYGNWQDLLVASLLLGILNVVLRPLLLLLSLPLLVFTLGLFTLVINAGLLWFVSELLKPGFHVADFKSAFWGALIISFVALVLNSLTGSGSARISVHHGPPPKPKSDADDDDGPVIDV